MGHMAGCETLPGSASLGEASKIGTCSQFPSGGPAAQAVRPFGAPDRGQKPIPLDWSSVRRRMLTGPFRSLLRIWLRSGLCAGRPGPEDQCDIWGSGWQRTQQRRVFPLDVLLWKMKLQFNSSDTPGAEGAPDQPGLTRVLSPEAAPWWEEPRVGTQRSGRRSTGAWPPSAFDCRSLVNHHRPHCEVSPCWGPGEGGHGRQGQPGCYIRGTSLASDKPQGFLSPSGQGADFTYLWSTSPEQLSGTEGHRSQVARQCDTSAPFGLT